jgi:mono/diheme cytochrome c family protein
MRRIFSRWISRFGWRGLPNRPLISLRNGVISAAVLLAGISLGAATEPQSVSGLLCSAADDSRGITFLLPSPHFVLNPQQSIHPQLQPEFTAEWTGFLRVLRPGRHTIFADAQVWLNGEEVQNTPLELAAGELPIRIVYQRRSGPARLQLQWESEHFGLEPIPASAFLARSPPPEIKLAEAQTRGREWVEMLNCAACHRSSNGLMGARGGPDLSSAGSKLKPEWIYRWLENPRHFRADSTMPALPMTDRERADLTAFLASLRDPGLDAAQAGGDRSPERAVEQGNHLFNRIGCAACHEDPSLALRGTGSKYFPSALAAYLRLPFHGWTGNLMPDFGLTQNEAGWLAAFLLENQRPEFEQPVPVGNAEKGRGLISSRGCVACHTVQDSRGALAPESFAPALEGLNLLRGCLSETPPPRSANYQLTPEMRREIAVYLQTPDVSEAPLVDVPRLLGRHRCQSCHEIQGRPAHWAGATQTPSLSEIGGKLKPDWIHRVLHQRKRARPWLEVRMPQYPDGALESIVKGLPAMAGAEPPLSGVQEPVARIRAGAQRLGNGEGGFSCISCHDCLGEKSTGDMRGADLAGMAERLREDWMRRWLREPSRITPGTAMPAFFSDPPREEAEARIDEILAAISAGQNMPRPSGLGEGAANYLLAVEDTPVVWRGFLPDSSPRSIAVGFPDGLSYVFDADACRIRYAWSGEFLNVKPTWHGRGALPPQLRGEKFFVAPEVVPWRMGNASNAPEVRFRGYGLREKMPEFRFTLNGTLVKQWIRPALEGGLRAGMEIAESGGNVWWHLPEGTQGSGNGTKLSADAEGWVQISRGEPARFEIWIPGPDLGFFQSGANTNR